MTDFHLNDASAWTLDNWGAAQATYRVRLGDHEPQPVVARIDASTLANAPLPDDGFSAIIDDVDRYARASIERLASSGRVTPELVLTPVDLARILGLDPTEKHDEPEEPAAQAPEEAEALAPDADEPGATTEPDPPGSDAPSDDPAGGAGADPSPT